MTLLRAFVAVQIPQEIKIQIMAQTLELRQQAGRGVRWGSVENIHITLKFLGDITAKQVDVLSDALQTRVRTHLPFEIALAGVGTFPNGTFPNQKRPRIIWVGLADGEKRLTKLQQAVEAESVALGHAPDPKPFSPHLTLGRVRESLTGQELLMLQNALTGRDIRLAGRFLVNAVHLMRSERKPAGPVYTSLSTAALGG